MDTKKPLKAAVSANLYRDANPRPLNLQRHGNYGPALLARQAVKITSYLGNSAQGSLPISHRTPRNGHEHNAD